VMQFRTKLEKLGVLFWEYDSPLHFERNVREHLIRQILQLIKSSDEHTTKRAKRDTDKKHQAGKALSQYAPQEKGPRIFLAYARQDLDTVKSIYHTLKLFYRVKNGYLK
jgi:hypothetical protein